MSSWHLAGDWGLVPAVVLGCALGICAWLLYRPAVRDRGRISRLLLPLLRSVAVFLVVMMLTGPAIRHRIRVGELAQLDIVIDASDSMALPDPEMSPGRELLLAERLGWLPSSRLVDTATARVAEQLAEVGVAHGADAEVAGAISDRVQQVLAELRAMDPRSLAGMSRKGFIRYERWDRIGGDTLDRLTQSDQFHGPPDHSDLRDIFASRPNQGSDFGDRLSGYLYPPETGDYTFWISGDDQSELWLSTDATPGDLRRIARVRSYTPLNRWDQDADQRSRPVRLDRGRRYFVEALHKEGGGEDHVAVGWRLPDGSRQRPIPGRYLAPAQRDDAGGEDGSQVASRFEREIARPAADLAGAMGDLDPGAAQTRLRELKRDLALWEEDLRRAFAAQARDLVARDEARLQPVLDRFERVSRSERVASLLLEGEEPVLAGLAREHDVSLCALDDEELTPLWNSRAGRSDPLQRLPERLAVPETASSSDLGLALAPAFDASGGDAVTNAPPRAVLLLSDGRHNRGASPLDRARILGARGVPIYSVGIGSELAAPDLAVAGVEAPASVFHRDTLKGRIVLHEHMPAGSPYTLRVRCLNEVVWERPLVTRGVPTYAVPFEVPLEDLAARAGDAPAGVERAGVTLDLDVELAPPPGDAETANNRSRHLVFATLRQRRVLYVEDRPRWEWRYLHALFARDPQWQIDAVLLEDGVLPRDDGRPGFPATREALFAYDLVLFGDVPAACWEPDELVRLAGFVEARGGGLVLLDGPRLHLAGYAETPLASLFPVNDLAPGPRTGLGAWSLPLAGAELPALNLAGAAGEVNESIWGELPPARHITRGTPVPGAEVLLTLTAGATNLPALVWHRVGAGKVLYQAFDETWRWRYRVEDLHHRRYWSQIALWLMEAPYAVRNAAGSLDAGAVQYPPGQAADLRARFWDAAGNLLVDVQPTAVLERNGEPFAQVPLAPDEARGGVLRSLSPPLEEGDYRLTVSGGELPDDAYALETRFSVRPPVSRERALLDADFSLLEQMARVSGGAYMPEEHIDRVVDRLRPLSEGNVIETETLLWQSYWWFAAILLLLTLEWILRKREGLL